MNSSINIIEPQTKEQFEAYYLLRYEVLRKPWNQPHGSERDGHENECIHFMAVDKDHNPIGVCRLQFNTDKEAQLRYMGVNENTQGLGVGRKLILHAEERARQEGAERLILQAREIAVDFYKKCGYRLVEKSYLMWGSIQHYLMAKDL